VKPRVFVTRRVPAIVRKELERSFTVDIHDEELPPPRAELLASVVGRDGLVTMLTDRVDAELLDAAGQRLRVIANYAVGLDNVDLEECERRGIYVANTPEVLTKATAEMTLALMLALTRRIVMLGRGLAGLMIGIVGWGRIGQEVGRLSRAHEMTLVHAGEFSLDDLLGMVDIVSLHVPLTEETYHLIGERELSLMKPTAYLVNTSRGPVVDEAALTRALAAGRIAGAALDVYESEPEVTAGLLELDNVVLVPHLGSATVEAREAMGLLCVESLRKALL
jgi:glyoxylate reductase